MIEALENELVAGVKLDAGLAVDAFGAELGAQLTLGLGAIAAGLARPTDLTL